MNMCFNERIIEVAKKLKVFPEQVKLLVYSQYGASTRTPEENLEWLENEVNK